MKLIRLFAIVVAMPLWAQDYNALARQAFTDSIVRAGLRYDNCDSLIIIDDSHHLHDERTLLQNGTWLVIKTDSISVDWGNKLDYSQDFTEGRCGPIVVTRVIKKGHKIALLYKCPTKDRAGKFVFIHRRRKFIFVVREMGVF